MLNIPKMKYQMYGEAAFCFYVAVAWNKLPLLGLLGFKKQLKTFYVLLLINCLFTTDRQTHKQTHRAVSAYVNA